MSVTAIDLFAGAGGFSTGATQAGCRVLWAANHWREAVDVHAMNHAGTVHARQDLHQTDWTTVPRHDIGLASPACQGHTRARGVERPHHDAQRSTAWAVVSCAECHRPPVFIVENVPEFLKWDLYPAWLSAMQALGYTVAPHIIDAADMGVPQNRVRVFLICTKSRKPLVLKLPKRDHVPASTVIDLAAGRWSKVDRPGRSTKTLGRIREGRAKHGARFLIAYYGNEFGGRAISRPLGTLTTRDRFAVVDGDRMRMLTVDECRAGMGFPENYKLPDRQRLAVHMLGNAVCPAVAMEVITAILGA